MTTTTDTIVKELDKKLNDLFNLAGLTLTAFIRKRINEDERNAILAEFNAEGLDAMKSAIQKEREETIEKIIAKIASPTLDAGKETPMHFQMGWNAALATLRRFLDSLKEGKE